MTTQLALKKPALLRTIFILNAFKIVLVFTFYFVFKAKGIQIGPVGPELILYTAIGYVTTFAMVVTSILKRNITALRIVLILDFAVSLPAQAYIGLLIAVVSISLSFTKKVKAYFAQ